MERPVVGKVVSQSRRSCQRCRRRKIRCDNGQPCSYCAKFGGEGCVYGETTAQKAPLKDQEGRLERIESSLARLERYFVDAQDGSQFIFRGGLRPSDADSDNRQEQRSSRFADGLEPDLAEQSAASLNEDQIVPVDPTFGASSHHHSGSHHEETASGVASITNIILPHPNADRIQALCHTYFEAVHPILPILDPASVEQQLQTLSPDVTNVPAPFECLMFAVYCASVIALRFWASQDVLPPEEWLIRLERYRQGFHLALTKADYLRKPDLVTLQAMTLFLFCVRTAGEKDSAWTMTAVMVRHAVRLGLNRDRDGPDIQVRGALWHAILVLDALSSRDQGLPAAISDDSYDARMPNSDQAAFLRYMCKIAVVSKQLILPLPFSRDRISPAIPSHEKAHILLLMASELKLTYPMVDDDAAPYIRFMSHASTILLTHLEILIHIAQDKTSTKVTFENHTLVNLLSRSLAALKLVNTLRRDTRISRWSWAIDTETDCDITAFILSALQVMKVSALYQGTKSTLEQFFEFGEVHTLTNSMRWTLLKGLRAEFERLPFIDSAQILQLVDVQFDRAIMSFPGSQIY